MTATILAVTWILSGCSGSEPDRSAASIDVARLLGGAAPGGDFSAATEPGAIMLPRDHAAHPDFRAEWWYVTGNLQSEDDRWFGFQLTFFRFAVSPLMPTKTLAANQSAWRSNQVYMAHLAVTDVESGTHDFSERLSRGALGLAGAAADPLRIWLDDWQIGGGSDFFPIAVSAESPDGDFGLELELARGKPVVFQGNDGLSAKGPEPGNASYYYSYTRLPASGFLKSGGKRYPVAGNAWIDREWSTSALGDDRVGWHWLSVQLDDGRDLMLYVIRQTDGSAAPESAGTLVYPDGSYSRLRAGDFSMTAQRSWVSPASGAQYPLGWHVRVGAHDIELDVEALVDDQEQLGMVRYWEGAIAVRPPGTSEPTGRGYLELTGY
jgi:predicted secreted hydrolase